MNLAQFLRLTEVVAAITHPDVEFVVTNGVADGRDVCLQVVGQVEDSRTAIPEQLLARGRKWRLSEHMTDGEVVQTAFLALTTWLEHEARERFRFMGQAVLDPHYDIYKLVALRQKPDAIAVRDEPAP